MALGFVAVWILVALAGAYVFGKAVAIADEEADLRFDNEVAAAMRRHPSGNLCRCGHGGELHRHYRAGTDCAACDCEQLTLWSVA